VATGEQRRVLADNLDVFAVTFAPDGHTLTTGGRDRVRVREVATGRLLLETGKPGNWTEAVAFSPDGRMVASGSLVWVQVQHASRGGLGVCELLSEAGLIVLAPRHDLRHGGDDRAERFRSVLKTGAGWFVTLFNCSTREVRIRSCNIRQKYRLKQIVD
jgi:hypothetical protein